jgi:hypothetical protein
MTGTLHKDLLVYMFMTKSHLIIVRIRNTSDNDVEKVKTHILFSINTFLNNVEKFCAAGQVTDDNIMWRMRTTRWMTKATNRLGNT